MYLRGVRDQISGFEERSWTEKVAEMLGMRKKQAVKPPMGVRDIV